MFGGLALDGAFTAATGSLDSPVRSLLLLGWSILWWGALGWLVGRVAAVWRRQGRLGVGLVTVSAVAPLTWLVSWWVRFGLGAFLGPETIRFAGRNLRMTWLFLRQTEGVRLTACAASMIALLVVWSIVVRRERSVLRPHSPGLAKGWVVVLLLVAAGSAGEAMRARQAAVPTRPVWRLLPATSLLASAWDSMYDEPLPDCLEPGELVPLAPARREGPTSPASVVLVAIESLRADVVGAVHQERVVMPTLERLATRGIRFTRVWAASTHSDYSDVAVLSSTYPLRSRRHHYYRPDDPWPRMLLWDVLRPLGFRTALISAQNESWGGMDAFLASPGLELLWDSRSAEDAGLPTRASFGDEAFQRAVGAGLRAGKVDDRLVVDRALGWLGQRSGAVEPFLLALNFQSSHFPYELDQEAPRPFEPWRFDFPASFTWYPPEATATVRNAYFNALSYIDGQLARLLEGLETLGLANETIVVVYGENGEAFHEHGLVTHASHPYEPALRVPLVVFAPGQEPRAVDRPASLIDVAPTVLGLLGVASPPAFQGVDALADRVGPRAIFFHNENPISRADGVVLDGRWKLWNDREIDRDLLFDLASDPREEHDLARARPARAQELRRLVELFRCRQLTYYESPVLYSRAFPPFPPAPAAVASGH